MQTEANYIAFNAAEYDSKSAAWTELADSTTSPALAGSAMVYNDTLGIDASSGNAQGSAGTDQMSYSLDFTSAGDYYLYVRVAGSFFAGEQNDSFFVPSDWGGSANQISNSMVTNNSDYNWARVSTTGDALGSGVRNSSIGSVNFSNVDGTEGTGGNAVTFSIAGREQDIQVDRFVFHTNASLDATTLDGLAVVPEPSTFAYMLLSVFGASVFLMRRRS